MPSRCGNCKQLGHTRTHCPLITYDTHYFDKALPHYCENMQMWSSLPSKLHRSEAYKNGEWLNNALRYNTIIPFNEMQINELSRLWRAQNLHQVYPRGSNTIFKHSMLSEEFKSIYMKGRHAGYITQATILSEIINYDKYLKHKILENVTCRETFDALFSIMQQMIQQRHNPSAFEDFSRKKGWWDSIGTKRLIKSYLQIENTILNSEFDVVKENVTVMKALLNYFWDKIPEENPIHKMTICDYYRLKMIVYDFVVRITITNEQNRLVLWRSLNTHSKLLQLLMVDNPIEISSLNRHSGYWKIQNRNNEINVDMMTECEGIIEQFLVRVRELHQDLTFEYVDYITHNEQRLQREAVRRERRNQERIQQRAARIQEQHRIAQQNEERKQSLSSKKEYDPNKIIESQTCCMCLEPLQQNNKVILPCGHQNCLQCLLTLHSQKSSNHNMCPLCRDDFTIVGSIIPQTSYTI